MIPEIGRNYRLSDGRYVECIGRNSLTMAVYVCLADNAARTWWTNPEELCEVAG